MPTIAANWLRPYESLAGIIIAWVGTNASIPANWTRVTALDGRFVKQIATSSTAPGATGGATTHDHPYPQHSTHTFTAHNHAGSWGNSPNNVGQPLNSNNTAQVNGIDANATHAHASSSVNAPSITTGNNSAVNTATAVNDPNHVTVIFIKAGGGVRDIPLNGVMWFNGAAPTGFAVYAALANRLMKGAAGGADGGTSAGTTTHTHVSPSHNHSLTAGHTHVVSLDAGGVDTLVNSEITAGPRSTHTHSLATSGGPSVEPTVDNNTETSDNGYFDPPWQKMRAIQKTGSAGIVSRVIGMWDGALAAIPPDWKLCDGANGTPNLCQGLFVRAASTDGEVGNTGGVTTHTHVAGAGHTHASSGSHTHSVTTISSASLINPNLTYGQSATFAVVPSTHTHASATYTSPAQAGVGTSSNVANALTASAAADPVFTGIAYIQRIAP